jgi:hypothetical protein
MINPALLKYLIDAYMATWIYHSMTFIMSLEIPEMARIVEAGRAQDQGE